MQDILHYYSQAARLPLIGYAENEITFQTGCSDIQITFFKRYIEPAIDTFELNKALVIENDVVFGVTRWAADGSYVICGPLFVGAPPATGTALPKAAPAADTSQRTRLKEGMQRHINFLAVLAVRFGGTRKRAEDFNPLKLQPEDDDDLFVHGSQQFENMIIASIVQGRAWAVAALMQENSQLAGDRGIVAHDYLRAQKNIFIASATIASRAAVRGGMDYELAMSVSDMYLQEMENLQSYQAVEELLFTMLVDYAARVQSLKELTSDSSIVQAASDYITRHIYHKITVPQIANSIGLSAGYLSHHFKKESGKSLAVYINEQKIKEAQYLLVATDKTILDISQLLKYASQNYFHTVFKEFSGTTPARYRKAHRL